MDRHVTSSALTLSVAIVAHALIVVDAAAQGCEPIRFTTPVGLGGQGEAYQPAHEWRLTLGYRRMKSSEYFVGTKENSALAPGGQSPIIRVHTVVADVAYSLNDRFLLRLSVPISTGSFTRIWDDSARHEQTATGVGDASLMGETWLLEPRTHQQGNVSIGLGVKAPTGSHTIASTYYTATGPVDFPADQVIEPGDGGWAVLLQSQAFRQLTERTYAYAFGSYMVSPKSRSNVRQKPPSGAFWSVPDVYSARLGGAYSVRPEQGLTLSLGARLDGIPVHDLLGGGDDATLKRTSRVLLADPGLSLTRGRGTFTASVPVRVHVNRQRSVLEQRTNGLNGGGFAKYLLFLSYSHRL